ncbi:MAG: amino acid ABC transporter permease [Deltaproteobacteria bacterium]|nr:amino acid ABC transporter permease [Deltaproteobacteria bacterium]MBW2650487.1 amino acid ABC transporter permease [Deltaproteobacteria bacterium]
MADADKDKPKKIVIDVGDGAAIPSKEDVGLFTAWRVAFTGSIAIVAYLAIFHPDPYWRILKFLPDGILVTFQVTIAAIILSLVIGLFTGLGRISKNKILNGIASLYVEVIRGIPLLVQLFYIYFALGRIVNVPAMASAIIAMSVCYGAYMGEIFRAGIESIPKGQMEAARSLGMTSAQAMRHVILPQAIKTILPPVGNEFVALLKDSSLVSILAVSDLLRRGREFAAESFNYFETYTMVALVYLIITLFLSKLISIMEDRVGANR